MALLSPFADDHGIAELILQREMRAVEMGRHPYGKQGGLDVRVARKAVRTGIRNLKDEYGSLTDALSSPEYENLFVDLYAFWEEEKFFKRVREELREFQILQGKTPLKEPKRYRRL